MSKIKITLKWAQTIDGQLADDTDKSQWISGLEERQYTHKLRAQHDAILVGAQTFLKDLCQLTVRDIEFDGLQPARVILDPRKRVLQNIIKKTNLVSHLETGPRKTYLVTDILSKNEELQLETLNPHKFKFISLPIDDLHQWLRNSLQELSLQFSLVENRNLERLMVEGGASTISTFLKAKLVDKLEVAISPLILGGRRHRVSSDSLLSHVERFIFKSKQQLGSDVVLSYQVENSLPLPEVP